MPNTFKNATGMMFQLGGGPLAWGGGSGAGMGTGMQAATSVGLPAQRPVGPARQSYSTGRAGVGLGMRQQAMRGLRSAVGRR